MHAANRSTYFIAIVFCLLRRCKRMAGRDTQLINAIFFDFGLLFTNIFTNFRY